MEHLVKIKGISNITPDTKRFLIEKPDNYTYKAGQATEAAIHKQGWKDKKRPFTFTSLNDSQDLEFIIKIYKSHKGVTNEFGKLKVGDELLIGEPWGAIEYKGPGYFIAGGAGITPFVAILRQLKKENKLQGNKLFFSNKTSKDVILIRELVGILGKDVIYTLTEEDKEGFDNRYIDEAFLRKEVSDFKKHFYLCGPPKMTEDINNSLNKLGASMESIIFEK